MPTGTQAFRSGTARNPPAGQCWSVAGEDLEALRQQLADNAREILRLLISGVDDPDAPTCMRRAGSTRPASTAPLAAPAGIPWCPPPDSSVATEVAR